MENKSQNHFIIIDDDPINNHICSRYIQLIFKDADIRAFTDPVEGLAYIHSTYPLHDGAVTILFLDINMPVLSGWDVLNRLEQFSEAIKQQFKIFILSSSIDIEDKQKAKDNPLVCDFIEKPLTIPRLENLLNCGLRS